MGIEYKNVVPWGRNLEEYKLMFNLSENDKKIKIFSVGDGPAGFNFEGTKEGFNIKSLDPIYKFTKNQIQQRINETFEEVILNTSKNLEKFNWVIIKDLKHLTEIRMNAMKLFLEDFEKGLIEKRYIYGELPYVEINEKFDLALSSHFLLLYSDNLNLEFHIKSIEKVLEISREFRIFPIYDLNNNLSPHLQEIIKHFENRGFSCKIVKSSYDFLKNGNEYLSINLEEIK